MGEYLQSAEAAIVRDVSELKGDGGPSLFIVQPAHNPIGPFDFSGGFDDRSDRRQPLGELMTRGYEDAYHQFIEPVSAQAAKRWPDLNYFATVSRFFSVADRRNRAAIPCSHARCAGVRPEISGNSSSAPPPLPSRGARLRCRYPQKSRKLAGTFA